MLYVSLICSATSKGAVSKCYNNQSDFGHVSCNYEAHSVHCDIPVFIDFIVKNVSITQSNQVLFRITIAHQLEKCDQ